MKICLLNWIIHLSSHSSSSSSRKKAFKKTSNIHLREKNTLEFHIVFSWREIFIMKYVAKKSWKQRTLFFTFWRQFKGRHKPNLAVPGKIFVLCCITSKCNLTKPYLTKLNIPCHNPAGSSLTLALSEATLPQPLTQILIARLLISKVATIWLKIFWDR